MWTVAAGNDGGQQAGVPAVDCIDEQPSVPMPCAPLTPRLHLSAGVVTDCTHGAVIISSVMVSGLEVVCLGIGVGWWMQAAGILVIAEQYVRKFVNAHAHATCVKMNQASWTIGATTWFENKIPTQAGVVGMHTGLTHCASAECVQLPQTRRRHGWLVALPTFGCAILI